MALIWIFDAYGDDVCDAYVCHIRNDINVYGIDVCDADADDGGVNDIDMYGTVWICATLMCVKLYEELWCEWRWWFIIDVWRWAEIFYRFCWKFFVFFTRSRAFPHQKHLQMQAQVNMII